MNQNLLHCCKASFILFFAFLSNSLSAQETDTPSCFTDQMRNHQMQADPGYAQRMNETEALIYQRTLAVAQSASKAGNEPVVLPVVVHIVHNNGPENISDAAVQEAIASLNDAFAHAGAFAQAGPGVDTKIQFCLARRTPDGQPTTGITRTVSGLTELQAYEQDIALKDLMRWDPTHYINIWVVKSITNDNAGVSFPGYSTLPFEAGSQRDGIVIQATHMNNNILTRNTFPHEIGHYLGLLHTFNGECENVDCLLTGDLVCDTPPDKATVAICSINSCHTDTFSGPFTSDVPDMSENFMDYSPPACQYRFTEGQRIRMLLLTTEKRSALLESDGCLDACPFAVSGGFTPLDTTVVVGKKVILKNTVQSNDVIEWYVNNVFFSNDPNPEFNPGQTGIYKIKQIAYDSLANCKTVTKGEVEVICNINGFINGVPETSPDVSTQFVLSGASVIDIVWKVNDQEIGTGNTISYTFPYPDIFEVKALLSNTVCSTEVSLKVKVQRQCSNSILPQYNFFSDENSYLHRMDMMADSTLVISGKDLTDRIFVLKLNKDFEKDWAVKSNFSTPYSFKYAKVFPTSDSGALLTVFGSGNSYYYYKINNAGKQIWGTRVKEVVAGSVASNANACNLDGTCISAFTRWVSGSNIIGYVKTAADGKIAWSKIINGSINQNIVGVARISGGGFYICTKSGNYFYVHQMDEDGNSVWSKNYVLVGYTPAVIMAETDKGFSISGAENGLLLVRGDSLGNILWVKRYAPFSSSGEIYATRFARKMPDGGFITGGQTSTLISPYFKDKSSCMRIGANGNLIWNNSVQLQRVPSTTYPDEFGVITDAIPFESKVIAGVDVWGLPGTYTEDYFHLMQLTPGGHAGGCIETSVNTKVTDVSISTMNNLSVTVSDIAISTDSLQETLFNHKNWFRSTDCESPSSCPEICENGVDDDKDGLVDCYDPNCNCFLQELCAVDSLVNPFSAKIAWVSDPSSPVNIVTIPLVGDMNRFSGARPEIMITEPPTGEAKGLFFKGDATAQNTPQKKFLSFSVSFNPAVTISAADFYRDGQSEIFTSPSSLSMEMYSGYTDTSLTNFRRFGFLNFNYTHNPYWRTHITDFNLDGKPEIYYGNAVSRIDYQNASGNSVGGSVIAPDTTQPFGRLVWKNFKYKSASPVVAELLTENQCGGDKDCDGPELAAGPVIYSIDMDGWDADPPQRTIEKDLNTLDPSPAVWSDGYTAVADINLDNKTDVVVAGKKDNVYGVYAWDINGLIKFFPYPENTPLSGGMPCIANVFDDRTQGFAVDYPEIIAASRNRLTCFNLNMANQQPNTPYWWSVPTTDPNGYTAATAFDFNADGFDEVVYHDATDLRMMYGGPAPLPAGVDEQRNWFKYYAPTLCSDQYPVIADCDGDNAAEIIFTAWPETGPVAGDSLAGRLIVLESANLPWAGCLPVWNQYGFNPNNVDKNLMIYQNPPGPSVTYSGGKKPFNKFLAQWPTTMDNNFNTYIPLPDLSMSIDQFECGDQQLRIDMKVCNNGAAGIQDSVPVCFFKGMPGVMPIVPASDIQYITQPIRQQECVVQSCWLPLAGDNASYYAVLNTTNTTDPLYANYQTTGVFPQAVNIECSYQNNFLPFTWNWPKPTLDLGPDVAICNGNSYLIVATPGFKEYVWDNGYTGPSLTADGPGTYIVTAKDLCGFPQSDTISIIPDSSHIIDLGPDIAICPGDSVLLSVPGFDELAWWPGEQSGCTGCNTVVLNPTFSNTYIVTGIAGSCFSTDDIQITVYPEMTLTGGSTPATNSDPTGTAWVVASGSSGPYSFVWSTIPVSAGDTIFQLLPGNYTVTATDKNGCTKTLVVTVEQTIAAAELLAGNIISLTPNPAIRQFRVIWESPDNTPYQLNIVDEQGKSLISRKLKTNHAELIDCSLWPAGSYTAYFTLGQKVYTRQIVVIK